MKISTKGDYAARALQDLAMHSDRGPISIERIASRQGLPLRYLEQLLLTLKRAGFLSSKRGVNGGYSLAKPPAQITLGEILRTVDGPIEPIHCIGDPPRHACAHETDCVLREVWAEVGVAVSAIVDRTTLQDLCDRMQARRSSSSAGDELPGGAASPEGAGNES
jgi:Rrf2 family protein